MIALLSPAKTLDFERALPPLDPTTPHFADEAHSLARSAARLSQKRLAELMHISPKLAKLNADRFADFPDLPQRPVTSTYAAAPAMPQRAQAVLRIAVVRGRSNRRVCALVQTEVEC